MSIQPPSSGTVLPSGLKSRALIDLKHVTVVTNQISYSNTLDLALKEVLSLSKQICLVPIGLKVLPFLVVTMIDCQADRITILP